MHCELKAFCANPQNFLIKHEIYFFFVIFQKKVIKAFTI